MWVFNRLLPVDYHHLNERFPHPKMVFCQGAVYEFPCEDCNLVYVGEIKRSFRTREKEHMRDVRNATTQSIEENSMALCEHAITLDYNFDWENSEVFTLETNYHKRRFIESFYTNQKQNSMNDKKIGIYANYLQ